MLASSESLFEYFYTNHLTSISITAAFLLIYFFYLRAFKYYAPDDSITWDERRSNRRRGVPPPSYPNGWFRICQSKDLAKGESRFFKINGRHITLFRGEDSIPYALHAYCSHMGANLGIGGKVKWNSCIECPFHGWAFDGKSGVCVNSEHLDAKACTHHEYNDIDNMTKDKTGKYISTCKTGEKSQIQKFSVCEKNNLIYVWFHAKNAEPAFEPFEVNDTKTYEDRGETTDYVCCQIQEIPENGADFKHFEYVHQSPAQALFPWVKFKWVPVDRKPTDSDFAEKMRNHPDLKIRKFANDLFDKFTNEKNKTHINNLVLDAYLVFFNRFEVYIQTAIVFQLGAGTVFLFLKFAFWDVIVVQSVTPLEKSKQIVHHKIFTKKWMPYILSAQLLAGFRKQFISDKVIWNNKIFANKLTYNPKSETDQRLLNWREWYSQYYDGSNDFEKKQEAFEW